jgi:fructokinase
LGWDAYPIARLNGDRASQLVKKDLQYWGVNLQYSEQSPPTPTPIIVQKIRERQSGERVHSFSCNCPYCGSWLPGFRAIRNDAANHLVSEWTAPDVFFFDRASRGILTLASEAEKSGSLIVFEPSAKTEPRHFDEALRLSHVVKYSNQRFPQVIGALEKSTNVVVEIQTCGNDGFRFRVRNIKEYRSWQHRPAMSVGKALDTAGSGDWFTAGLISQLGVSMGENIPKKGEIDRSLRTASAYAAWNCLFEGPRGGMYHVNKRQFVAQTTRLIEGQMKREPRQRGETSILDPLSACPVCATEVCQTRTVDITVRARLSRLDARLPLRISE